MPALEDMDHAALVGEIRKLRQENQRRRHDNDYYEQAFKGLTDGERNGMLRIVSRFSENREAGAMLFRQLADSVSPAEEAEETANPTDSPEEENTMSENTSDDQPPAWAEALIQRLDTLEKGQQANHEASQEAGIRAIKAEATELGYTEGTPEWQQLFRLASTLTEGDLTEASAMREKLYGPLEGEEKPEGEPGGEGEETPEGENAEQEKPKPNFPPQPKGGSGAPAAESAGKDELDFRDKGAVAKAAIAYLENVESDGS